MARVPPGVRAVFFDAVGTLLLPRPSAPAVYAAVARDHGLNLTVEQVRARFVTAYRREEAADAATDWATSEARERARWYTIVTETLTGASDPDACYHHLFAHFARPTAWELAPGAAEVVAALHARGFTTGLGSNYDERLWPVLAGFPELNPLKDRVLISATVGVRKPGAGFFRAVARAAQCDPSEVLFVGDDIDNDYAGATATGMPALLLDPEGRSPEVPHRITRLRELVD